MDTTETYIKMCDCDEIQIKVPSEGVGGTLIGGNIWFHIRTQWSIQNDLEPEGYYWQTDETYIDVCEACGNEEQKYKTTKCIWLPRQEDLQAMLPYGPPSTIHKLHDFMESRYPPNVSDEDWTTAEIVFETWNQIWLALVMKENHNKFWDGEEWII